MSEPLPTFKAAAWKLEGACVSVDYSLFDPPHGGESADSTRVRVWRAKQVCQGCPVLDTCQLAGLEGKETGVWGGLLLEGGKIVRRIAEPPKPKAERVPCGTESAYKRHRRRGERPCMACKVAHTNVTTAQRQRARAMHAARQAAAAEVAS